MTFDEAMKAAAKVADAAIARTMRRYAGRYVTDEDDISGNLVGAIDMMLQSSDTPTGLQWSSTMVRHRRGVAAEESRTGADIVIHVELDTPTHKYSKGVLVQAKRCEPGDALTRSQHSELIDQCNRMLDISSHSYVFDYAKRGMRVASANKIKGATGRELYQECDWTSYRFLLGLFQCPVGDQEITSALVDKLPVPYKLKIAGSGELALDRRFYTP
jgi:hypothetical protein